MNFNAYQELAAHTAVYPDPIIYPTLGLAGEAGEVANKIAKAVRDGTPIETNDIAKELGDVLWMLAALASDLGLELGDIAEANLEKLQDRMARGVLRGSGDNR